MSRALVLTYHAVAEGPPPLFVEPRLFERHLDAVVESGAQSLTVGQLADALHDDRLPERAVAITFDDGLASVPANAATLLADRGLVGTIFCVAERLGKRSDWPSQARWAPVLPLASATELGRLAEAGWEIGSHGLDHAPLVETTRLRHELTDSRRLLERATGAAVRSFAFPYGVVATGAEAVLEEAGYSAACTIRAAAVRPGTDRFSLPRVDVHYLRRPKLLRAALAGRLDPYIRARHAAAGVRRLVRTDYA